MYSLTINGNSLDELFGNLRAMLETKPSANPASTQQVMTPISPIPNTSVPFTPPAAPVTMAPVTPAVPAVPVAVTAPTAIPTFAPAASPLPAVPVAAPSYTLEQLAHAGGALLQAGKAAEATALLAKYGVRFVNELKPEQYGAFATELRALGAQI
jgi:hypothetical protein